MGAWSAHTSLDGVTAAVIAALLTVALAWALGAILSSELSRYPLTWRRAASAAKTLAALAIVMEALGYLLVKGVGLSWYAVGTASVLMALLFGVPEIAQSVMTWRTARRSR